MIRGFFHPDLPELPSPFVGAVVTIPSLDVTWRPVSFLVDTGAHRTFIHPTDAREILHIPKRRLISPPPDWGSPGSAGGVGGGADYYEFPATLGFADSNGGAVTREVNILLGRLTPANAAIPSLLGWDVLRHFELRTNWLQRIVQLDRV